MEFPDAPDRGMPMPTQQEPEQASLREPPTEAEPLAVKWAKRIAHARTHWEKFHKRVAHNRKVVAGFNWKKEPDSKEFYEPRANLMHGSITAILPNIYARNPEISVTQNYQGRNVKLLCQTLEKVTNRSLTTAKLKRRAKSAVRSALTTSFGAVKVMYQRDMTEDPVIKGRINDTQDNIKQIEYLIASINDPERAADLEVKQQELNELMKSLNEQVEIVAAEGLVIDRVMTERLLFDPSVIEFFDYEDCDWIAQEVPMKRSAAEALYKIKLGNAKAFKDSAVKNAEDGRLASAKDTDGDSDDVQICIVEIWDKVTERVYTMAEGCKFWLREPYAPAKVGERWYPFFLLPYQVVDGNFIGPSFVDLTEKLQQEHNDARDGFNEHRKLCKPGWIASDETNEKTIKRHADSELGEITLIDTQGKPLSSVIIPRQHPPIDPMVYETSAVRTDWEQVTGLQDAARSTVVKPKTATEAGIMQQALSGRVAEFRDQVEDWLQEISQYAAQILLLELEPPQVERIMGPPVEQPGPDGQPVFIKQYDWPQLSRDEVFDLVSMEIRAGTTGSPDKLEQQENWIKLMPVIQPLIDKIMQLVAQGVDATPYKELLKETVARFDDKLDIEKFIPSAPAPATAPTSPPAAQPAAPEIPAAAQAALPSLLKSIGA